jgi:hypothetical protein
MALEKTGDYRGADTVYRSSLGCSPSTVADKANRGVDRVKSLALKTTAKAAADSITVPTTARKKEVKSILVPATDMPFVK